LYHDQLNYIPIFIRHLKLSVNQTYASVLHLVNADRPVSASRNRQRCDKRHCSYSHVLQVPPQLRKYFRADNESVEKVTLRKALSTIYGPFDLLCLFGLLLQRGDLLHYSIVSCLTAYRLLLFAALRPTDYSNPGPYRCTFRMLWTMQ
jgi:hypothetical protein